MAESGATVQNGIPELRRPEGLTSIGIEKFYNGKLAIRPPKDVCNFLRGSWNRNKILVAEVESALHAEDWIVLWGHYRFPNYFSRIFVDRHLNFDISCYDNDTVMKDALMNIDFRWEMEKLIKEKYEVEVVRRPRQRVRSPLPVPISLPISPLRIPFIGGPIPVFNPVITKIKSAPFRAPVPAPPLSNNVSDAPAPVPAPSLSNNVSDAPTISNNVSDNVSDAPPSPLYRSQNAPPLSNSAPLIRGMLLNIINAINAANAANAANTANAANAATNDVQQALPRPAGRPSRYDNDMVKFCVDLKRKLGQRRYPPLLTLDDACKIVNNIRPEFHDAAGRKILSVPTLRKRIFALHKITWSQLATDFDEGRNEAIDDARVVAAANAF